MPYSIQGRAATLAQEPFQFQGSMYVPLRAVTQALGGSVVTDTDENHATATIGPWVAAVIAGTSDCVVTGGEEVVPVLLSAPPFLSHEEMQVPFDFFSDVFGYDVSMAGDAMIITNPNADLPSC